MWICSARPTRYSRPSAILIEKGMPSSFAVSITSRVILSQDEPNHFPMQNQSAALSCRVCVLCHCFVICAFVICHSACNTRLMKSLIRAIATLCVTALTLSLSAAEKLYTGKPLKGLIITGGCCHNYKFQAEALTTGIAKVADVEFTVINEGGTGTRAEIDLYKNTDWAKPYDVIIHNECFADTTNEDYIRSITAAHKAGKPAMVIHCAMHTYRSAKIDDWREFLGVTSKHHEHMAEYPVKVVAKEHPIMKG